MKTLKVLVATVLLVAMIAVPAVAATYVPSVEREGVVTLVSAETSADNRAVVIVPYEDISLDDFIDEASLGITADAAEAIEDAVRESLQKAQVDLSLSDMSKLVSGFASAWDKNANGAPTENAVAGDLFEIVLIDTETGKMVTDEKVTVSFKPSDAVENFVVICKHTGDDTWTVEDHSVKDGVITVALDKLSPFAIAEDNGAAPASDIPSPQTGENVTGIIIAAVSVLVLLAAAVVIGTRLRKSTSK